MVGGHHPAPIFKPAFVLRYHDRLDVVKQRLRWLRELNPRVPVHGIYGGQETLPAAVIDLFDSHYSLDLLPELAWRNMDLALLEWYRALGQSTRFSHLYVQEWDLVYLAPLHEVMPLPMPGQSLLTGYTPLSMVEWKWDWTNGKRLGPLNEWLELKRFVAGVYHFYGPYYASIGPGAVLSREFLDFYMTLELPLLCNDALRLPLVHAVGSLQVADTKLYPPDWYQPEHVDWIRRFNVRRWDVAPSLVAKEVRQGYTAFHPVSNLLDEKLLKRALSRYNVSGSAPRVISS